MPAQSNNRPQIFTPAIGNILDCLRDLLATVDLQATNELPAHLPFTGGWLGWLGYELAWEIEKLPDLAPDLLPFPTAYWYAPSAFAILDHWEQVLYLAAPTGEELDGLVAGLGGEWETGRVGDWETGRLGDGERLEFLTSEVEYQRAILRAQEYIQAGDIFQTNISLRFST